VEDRDSVPVSVQPQADAGVRVSPYRAPAPLETARAEPSRAVDALLARAQDQLAAEDLLTAGSTLERAARIDPRDPRVWQQLAEVRYREGEYRRAVDLALRSNTNAGPHQQSLQADNWDLIARCRLALGDRAGADAAAAQARRLRATTAPRG
jgi:predicted Zn-dependent protease